MVKTSMLWRACVLSCGLWLSACGGEPLHLQGESPITWSSLRGQWVFINYWAEWCKPCLQELPELNRFGEQTEDATVLGVNYDGVDESQLQRLREQFGIRFSLLLHDPSVNLAVDRPSVLPATLVFDPSGTYKATLLGPQTQETLSEWLGK